MSNDPNEYFLFCFTGSTTKFAVSYSRYSNNSEVRVEIESANLDAINNTLQVFLEDEDSCSEYFKKGVNSNQPKIFIGHGGSAVWRELKDHLSDKHGINVVAYETGSRAGHTIRDVLEEMSKNSNMAFLVLTAEDELENGTKQARPNVIHETGLFQGKLGFGRAIVLLENGCEEFSNLAGIQQLRFSKGNIREAFGDALATIRRESLKLIRADSLISRPATPGPPS